MNVHFLVIADLNVFVVVVVVVYIYVYDFRYLSHLRMPSIFVIFLRPKRRSLPQRLQTWRAVVLCACVCVCLCELWIKPQSVKLPVRMRWNWAQQKNISREKCIAFVYTLWMWANTFRLFCRGQSNGSEFMPVIAVFVSRIYLAMFIR